MIGKIHVMERTEGMDERAGVSTKVKRRQARACAQKGALLNARTRLI